jgi:Peptidase family M23
LTFASSSASAILTGKPLTLTKWRFRVNDSAGKVALDADALSRLKVEKSLQTLNEFYHSFDLPKDFIKGTLRIEAAVELGGKPTPLIHEVPVERVEGYAISAPVDGVWGCGGGPGCAGFHGHLHDIYGRYCYDLGLFKEINGERASFSGDPFKNESFFNWDKPIYCVEDGKVILVVDDAPDNFGQKANPANVGMRNNRILVEHAGGLISTYYHVRQGSAKVKFGQPVKAGQVLAHLGNAGSSSEPHLHFGLLAYDRRVGYYKIAPVRIKNLKTENGLPAAGIVKDGFYRFTPAGTGRRG